MLNFIVLLDFIKRLYRSRYMLKMMTLRELKASYIGSAFGVTWAIFTPLFQVAIYGVVFGLFFKSRPDPVYGTDSYFLFLLCGLVPWQFFSQTMLSSTGAIVNNLSLVKKAVGFPSEVLPIVTTISNIISHLISMALLLIIIFLSPVKTTIFMPLIFLYLFLISLFAIGLGWVLAGVNIFLRDVQQALGIVIMGWFFLTPVFYSPSIVPQGLLPVMKINPLYHVVEGYRLALLAGRPLAPWDFLYLAVLSLGMLAAGGIFFRKLKPLFAEML